MFDKPYEFQPYPSVRYHASGATRRVKNEREDAALMAEGGWADTPAAFPAVEAPAACETCGRAFEPATEAATEGATPAAEPEPAVEPAPAPAPKAEPEPKPRKKG